MGTFGGGLLWAYGQNYISGGAASVTGSCTDDGSVVRTTINACTATGAGGAATCNGKSIANTNY